MGTDPFYSSHEICCDFSWSGRPSPLLVDDGQNGSYVEREQTKGPHKNFFTSNFTCKKVFFAVLPRV